MTDAQPGDQLVAALVAALPRVGRLCDCEVHLPHALNCPTKLLRAALPIAREMAARERELVAALEDVLAHTSNRGCLCSTNDRLIRALLDRAHAAGVEVTDHE